MKIFNEDEKIKNDECEANSKTDNRSDSNNNDGDNTYQDVTVLEEFKRFHQEAIREFREGFKDLEIKLNEREFFTKNNITIELNASEFRPNGLIPVVSVGVTFNCIDCKTRKVKKITYGLHTWNLRKFEDPWLPDKFEDVISTMNEFKDRKRWCKPCRERRLLR